MADMDTLAELAQQADEDQGDGQLHPPTFFDEQHQACTDKRRDADQQSQNASNPDTEFDYQQLAGQLYKHQKNMYGQLSAARSNRAEMNQLVQDHKKVKRQRKDRRNALGKAAGSVAVFTVLCVLVQWGLSVSFWLWVLAVAGVAVSGYLFWEKQAATTPDEAEVDLYQQYKKAAETDRQYVQVFTDWTRVES